MSGLAAQHRAELGWLQGRRPGRGPGLSGVRAAPASPCSGPTQAQRPAQQQDPRAAAARLPVLALSLRAAPASPCSGPMQARRSAQQQDLQAAAACLPVLALPPQG